MIVNKDNCNLVLYFKSSSLIRLNIDNPINIEMMNPVKYTNNCVLVRSLISSQTINPKNININKGNAMFITNNTISFSLISSFILISYTQNIPLLLYLKNSILSLLFLVVFLHNIGNTKFQYVHCIIYVFDHSFYDTLFQTLCMK